MPLTDIACKNAACPPGRQRLRLSDSAGLYLEVLPAGGKYWRLKFRHGGKEKKLALGIYPHVSIKEARLARAGDRPRRSAQDREAAAAPRERAILRERRALPR